METVSVQIESISTPSTTESMVTEETSVFIKSEQTTTTNSTNAALATMATTIATTTSVGFSIPSLAESGSSGTLEIPPATIEEPNDIKMEVDEKKEEIIIPEKEVTTTTTTATVTTTPEPEVYFYICLSISINYQLFFFSYYLFGKYNSNF